ncbi:MAG: peptidylprolyl isomerase [Parcubacteria group bacterium Gr01-1014_8]|nr:MAG: peptidylprolyl isomerase [Parcubacteria group bacterium Gr01-1014_8]
MRYRLDMGKIIAILVVIILIGGGIYYWMTMQPTTGETPNTDQQAEATTASDQVQGQDVKVGEGKEATPGSQVSILYEGRLQDGTIFDSSAAHNNEPLVFVLGAQGLIPGFQIGVNGMKEGGERLILIPPSLGYGEQEVKDAAGKVIIPANSPLVFSIKLQKVEAAPAAPVTP